MRAANLTLARRILLIALLLLPWTGLTQSDFVIDWFGIASGGGNSGGGDFELAATVGQPAVGDLLGGDFNLTGGFWSIATIVETPVAISVSVSLSAGRAIISWPESGSEGFDLEEAGALAATPIGTVWTRVNATAELNNGVKSVRVPLTGGNRFYRLHKP